MLYDSTEREYILDHGGYFNKEGLAVIPWARFEREQYTHMSYTHPGKWAWMIPCQTGPVLLFEGIHFRLEGETMKYDTKREAVEAWVDKFNEIPKAVIKKLRAQSYRADLKEIDENGEEVKYGTLPMWDTMWSFGDSIDNDWLNGEFGVNGLKQMIDCGFRVYKSEDWGYVFGIDGAGYDFFEAHWIPLYDARGLKWHREG